MISLHSYVVYASSNLRHVFGLLLVRHIPFRRIEKQHFIDFIVTTLFLNTNLRGESGIFELREK